MMAASEVERPFFVKDTPESYVLTTAINALGGPGRTGFAIEGPFASEIHCVTPLLDASSEGADSMPFTHGADAQVYSIVGCS